MYCRQPRYFSDFHCIGGNCKDSCCIGWRITWGEDEINKVKNAPNCSQELKDLCERAFEPDYSDNNTKGYRVVLGNDSRCPFLTEDNLCKIQKELGAEYLSGTCMHYPRRHMLSKPTLYSFCNMSCPEVIKKIITDDKALDLINLPIKKELNVPSAVANTDKLLAKHPELKYRGELFEFFFELLSDKKHDIETNIILGALAAQALTKLVRGGEVDRIPEALKAFKSQMHNGAHLKSVEKITPNYHLCFGFVGKLLKEVIGYSFVNTLSDETGTLNIDHYNIAKIRFQKRFKDRPFFLRNIALNLLLEYTIPFKLTEKTILENYGLFVAAFACIKLNLFAIELASDKITIEFMNQSHTFEGEERQIGLTSIICRGICQSDEKLKMVFDFLNQYNFTSPAYLALLVK